MAHYRNHSGMYPLFRIPVAMKRQAGSGKTCRCAFSMPDGRVRRAAHTDRPLPGTRALQGKA